MRKTACKNVNGRIASATLRGFLLKSAESLLADQERPQCTRSQQQHAQHDARLSPRLLLRIQLADLPDDLVLPLHHRNSSNSITSSSSSRPKKKTIDGTSFCQFGAIAWLLLSRDSKHLTGPYESTHLEVDKDFARCAIFQDILHRPQKPIASDRRCMPSSH
jgi:hypothetical protein